MKLLRYILSHGLLLLLIAALVLAYYYRAQLFSADINAQIDHAVERTVAWTEIFRNNEPAEVNEQATQPASEQEQLVTEQPVAIPKEAPISTAETAEPVAPVEAMPMPETTVTQSEMMPVPEAAVTQKASEPQDDKSAAAPSNADLLNQARTAFANGMPEQAIKLYEELNELNADDPNIPGELGNVFYAQGKWKKAGAAYYEAATRLIAQGQMGQVQYLYRVIQGLDPDSAEKLRGQLGG